MTAVSSAFDSETCRLPADFQDVDHFFAASPAPGPHTMAAPWTAQEPPAGEKGQLVSFIPTPENIVWSNIVSSGHDQRPAPQKTALVSDRFDVHEAGNVYNMYKRLKAGRKQVARGTRCLTCKQRKKKCDGARPCARCISFGIVCGDDEASPKTVVVELSTPLSQPTWTFAMPDAPATVQGTAEFGILNKFLEFGWSKVEAFEMFFHLPPRLRQVLVRLTDFMNPEQAGALRPMLPEEADGSWWKDSTVCAHLKQSYAFNGMSFSMELNNQQATNLCGHPEEVVARMCSAEIPMASSQYRILCMHLEYFLCYMGAENTHVHFFPFVQVDLQGNFKRVVFERSRVNLYADGVTYNSVWITAPEYDRAVQHLPTSRGRFLECDLSGAALVMRGQTLKHEESIANMMRSVPGREKLERLADKIIALFGLDAPPLAPSLPPPLPAYALPPSSLPQGSFDSSAPLPSFYSTSESSSSDQGACLPQASFDAGAGLPPSQNSQFHPSVPFPSFSLPGESSSDSWLPQQ